MRNDLASVPRAAIHCDKCNRQVDTITIERPVRDEYWSDGGYVRLVHTGEIIAAIECHGERWAISNWRGRL